MKKIVLSKCAILFYAITCIRKYYLEEIWTEKIWAKVFKQTEKANKQWYGEKFSFFFYASNSSNIEEEIIKQINKLKPLDMEPCKAIPKKRFVSKEQNNCEEKISLTPQDRSGDIDWCKCVWEC